MTEAIIMKMFDPGACAYSRKPGKRPSSFGSSPSRRSECTWTRTSGDGYACPGTEVLPGYGRRTLHSRTGRV